MAVRPTYVPPENTSRKKMLLKQPGQYYKMLDENLDDVNSPPVIGKEDPFKEWLRDEKTFISRYTKLTFIIDKF